MPQTPRLTDPAYQKFLDAVPVKPPPPPPPFNPFRFEIVNDLAQYTKYDVAEIQGLSPLAWAFDDADYCIECHRAKVECPQCGYLGCVLLCDRGPDEYLMMPCNHYVVLDEETAACLGLGA